jgi:D-apionolactonase
MCSTIRSSPRSSTASEIEDDGTVTDLRMLHGTDEPLQELRPLRAGPVSLFLDGIDLRYLRIGGTELVRRVYTAVRDVDWDTVPGAVSGFELEERDAGFRAEFDVRHARGDIDFSWHGTIAGDESGRIEFVFDGRARSVCPYNRIGICVHHPWRETAGARYRSRTPKGEQEGAFPDLIGQQAIVDGAYQALFPAYDRLEVELAGGGTLLFEFEGDLWETEDHRNWTDANFKTYSTPISLGRPAPLEAGQPLRQRLVVTPIDVPDTATEAGPVRLTVGPPTGTRVPPIGLGQDRDAHVPDDRERELLAALAPAHLRVEVRLTGGDWRDHLAAARETAHAAGASLELALMFRDQDATELEDVAAALDGCPVARVLVTYAGGRTATPLETTPPHLVDLAREALVQVAGEAAFVGGTEMYFTEVNRTRPGHDTWDGICYSVSPQIHAFTDIDVMENLDAQAETVRSARAIADCKPVAVSPVTLRRRVNFHAAGEPPPTPAGQLPDSVDVRQSALFAAAWTAGSVKYMSESGAGSVTYYETTGWRGVVERADGPELPERFVSRSGEAFPLYHPLADAIEWHGSEVLACGSSDVLAAVGFAVRGADGATHLLVANLTPHKQAVVVEPLDGEVTLRRLNESTASLAAADPPAFRSNTELAVASRELALTLAPYEVVRVDS